MNPRSADFMRNKLSRWGYPRYLVDRLKPWSLIGRYSVELRKRDASRKTDPPIDSAIVVIDSNVSPSLDSSIIDTVIAERINLRKTPKKYRGIVIKNDNNS